MHLGAAHARAKRHARSERDVGALEDLQATRALLAAQAAHDGRAVPLALPVRNGVSSYSTALFVAERSKLRRAEDLAGVRAAWVDRQSVSGYLLARAALRARGIDLERAFAVNRFVGSHDAVVQAVLDGSADVGATFVYLDDLNAAPVRAGWGSANVRVLAHAGPIPADILAAGARVPAAIFQQVQRLLLNQRHAGLRDATTKLFGTSVFVAPIASHLDALAALLPSLDEQAQPRPPLFPKR